MNSLLELATDRCHLWITDPETIEDPELLAAYGALLAPEEVVRHARFRFPQHRQLFLVTRALVRTTLSRYAPVAPAAWRFGQGEHGRPFISAPRDYRHLGFNISHTAGMIVCLVGRRTVGVDVEQWKRRTQSMQLAERFFSPSEVADLESLTGLERQRRFFGYWTLKESYLKAVGKGLSMPLNRVTFTLTAGQPIRASLAGSGREYETSWQFWQMPMGPDHLVAASLANDSEPELAIDRVHVVPLVEERFETGR